MGAGRRGGNHGTRSPAYWRWGARYCRRVVRVRPKVRIRVRFRGRARLPRRYSTPTPYPYPGEWALRFLCGRRKPRVLLPR